jgi:DNA recombination protein Rad52
MAFTAEQFDALTGPLDRAKVRTRKQGGKELSYIEAWHAIDEANRIFGFDMWDRETVLLTETNRDLVELKGDSGPYNQWRVGYLAKVRITVHTNDGATMREGTGFGSGMANPAGLGDAIESAIKEAESDAMKRALMTFGNPFGLALYDKTQANVAVAPPPRSAAVVAGEATLIMCRSVADYDDWGAKNKAAVEQMSKEDRAHLMAMWKRGRASHADTAVREVAAEEAFA